MKKLVFTLLLALPLSLMSQPHHHKGMKMNPEEQAVLKAKAMRLHLDLTEAQEGKIKNVIQNQLQAMKAYREKAQMEKPSEYERKLHQLNSQLALQEQMKTILSAEQFEQWKNVKGQKNRMSMRPQRSRPPQKRGMKPRDSPRKEG